MQPGLSGALFHASAENAVIRRIDRFSPNVEFGGVVHQIPGELAQKSLDAGDCLFFMISNFPGSN